MLWSRGGQGDFEDWVELGNPGWGWADLLPYFMKTETYTPLRDEELAVQFSIQDDPGIHGYSGPVNVSYPNYLWNTSTNFFEALSELGIPTAYDPNVGNIAGASFLPMDLDPADETRSHAMASYYEPYESRANFWVCTGQFVTQILFDGVPANSNGSASTSEHGSVGQGGASGINGGLYGSGSTLNITDSTSRTLRSSKVGRFVRSVLDLLLRRFIRRQSAAADLTGMPVDLRASGVEFAADSRSPRRTVAATREIVLSAGAIHSPQLLLLSGIGPAAALDKVGIQSLIDLPGVGTNLQDHAQVWCYYPFSNDIFPSPIEIADNTTFAHEAWNDFFLHSAGPLTGSSIDGVAFPALLAIVNGSSAIPFQAQAIPPEAYLPNDSDPTVLAGYTAQLPLLISALVDSTRAAYEILNANDGVLTVATMRPFTRGTVALRSAQPFDTPLIDPRYGSNPIDLQVLQAAILFNRRILDTESMAELEPQQLHPSASASDSEILQWILSNMQTEYHPAGSNAMMPLELGGVVDANLLVYGTQNLRVVDASIMPLIPAAHLQAVVYAIAEKASDIIKAANANAWLEPSIAGTATVGLASNSTSTKANGTETSRVMWNTTWSNTSTSLAELTNTSRGVLTSNSPPSSWNTLKNLTSSTVNISSSSTSQSVLSASTTSSSIFATSKIVPPYPTLEESAFAIAPITQSRTLSAKGGYVHNFGLQTLTTVVVTVKTEYVYVN